MVKKAEILINASEVESQALGHFSGYCDHAAMLKFLESKGIKANLNTKKPFAYIFALAKQAKLTKENKEQFLKDLAYWQSVLGFKKPKVEAAPVTPIDANEDQEEEDNEENPAPEAEQVAPSA